MIYRTTKTIKRVNCKGQRVNYKWKYKMEKNMIVDPVHKKSTFFWFLAAQYRSKLSIKAILYGY